MIEKIESFLDHTFRKSDVIFISLISFLFAVLRLPSVSEPYWYGDEGIYEVIGMALRQGRILYSGIWDNKPPLLYVIYAIFNGDQFFVRAASLIVGLLAVLVFFMVSKKLLKGSISSYVATGFFALMFAIPTVEGNIANAENFMILPILITFYILFCTKSKHSFFLTALAGIILSLAFLTKIDLH